MLSRSAEYAVRALAHLGTGRQGTWVLSREIAEELGMPPPFLAKILQTLVSVEILASQRGRGGGFKLVRDPESLTLFEIVEPFDHLAHRTVCVLGQKLCSDEHACPLHHAWKSSRTTFLDALQRTALADVLRMEFPGSFPWGVRPVRPGPA